MVERKKGKKLQVKVSIDTVHVGEKQFNAHGQFI
ncbi:hypothetical protein APLC1_4578 [Limnospira platensis C1]|nr:hypothetical protein APLC1_4578 [Arthrospira platensis C1]